MTSSAVLSAPQVQSHSHLVAIVCTDVKASTAAVHENEVPILRKIRQDLHWMIQESQRFGGHSLGAMGDGLVLVFPSTSQAVAYGIEVQKHFAQSHHGPSGRPETGSVPPNWEAPPRLWHRIGIHLGELTPGQELQEQPRFIADQLQHLAPPGGICLSRAVSDSVQPILALPLQDGGLHQLEGLPHPLRVYQLSPQAIAELPQRQTQMKSSAHSDRRLMTVVFTTVQDYQHRLQHQGVQVVPSLQRDLQQLTQISQRWGGQVVKTLGSGLLICFASVRQATLWAKAVQGELAQRAQNLPQTAVLQHRISLHLGDVERLPGDIAGNTVNLAARLLAHAPNQGICFSCVLYDTGIPQLLFPLAPEQGQVVNLKGISHPVSVYVLEPHQLSAPLAVASDRLSAQALQEAYAVGERDFSDRTLAAIALPQTDLSQVNFSNSNLDRANLQRSNLTGARLGRTHFQQANLRGTNLHKAYCNLADFQGANLQGADLSEAHLSHANFAGANLQGCNLRNARISNAYFDHTNVSGADLTGAWLSAFQMKHLITDANTIYPDGGRRAGFWQKMIRRG